MKNYLLLFMLLAVSLVANAQQTEYLKKVSHNLDQIGSASYYSVRVASLPEDTLEFSTPRKLYHKFVVNPSDPQVGSSYASYSPEDTTKMIEFYNGVVSGKVDWNKQAVAIDSFKNNPAPFRMVYFSFYTQVNEIIKYALTTSHAIRTDFKDHGDSVFFSLKIIGRHMYFVTKPIQIKNEHIPENEISQYDIWFNKKNNMPYSMRSRWHHTTLFEHTENAVFNRNRLIAFNEKDHYPSYFKVNPRQRGQQKKEDSLIGKKAPEWILNDLDQNKVKLSDLKSKVLVVQFTGVGCGPCHQSIPFIKQLIKEYGDKDFEFISVETSSSNLGGLKRYQQKNALTHKFLVSNIEMVRAYHVSLVPAFFVLDEKRVIRTVIYGYDSKSINSKIKAGINELL